MTGDATLPPPPATASRPGGQAEALVTARKIRELRETTRQHGEQLVVIVTQLGALTEQVGQITARHTDLAAAVSEDLAPRVGALHQLVTEELGRLRSDLDVLLAERHERDKTKNPPVDWATLTEEQAAAQWPILARWVGEVLVPRYELTRDDLPDCWALHSPVVAELSWLRTADVQAYLTRSSPQLGADWHTRWRPAVLAWHADRAGVAERGATAFAVGRANVLVAVLRPRLPSRPGAAPGPRHRGRAELIPGPAERLTPAAGRLPRPVADGLQPSRGLPTAPGPPPRPDRRCGPRRGRRSSRRRRCSRRRRSSRRHRSSRRRRSRRPLPLRRRGSRGPQQSR